MRQIIEVLRLKYESGLSHERIARACGISGYRRYQSSPNSI